MCFDIGYVVLSSPHYIRCLADRLNNIKVTTWIYDIYSLTSKMSAIYKSRKLLVRKSVFNIFLMLASDLLIVLIGIKDFQCFVQADQGCFCLKLSSLLRRERWCILKATQLGDNCRWRFWWSLLFGCIIIYPAKKKKVWYPKLEISINYIYRECPCFFQSSGVVG